MKITNSFPYRGVRLGIGWAPDNAPDKIQDIAVDVLKEKISNIFEIIRERRTLKCH